MELRNIRDLADCGCEHHAEYETPCEHDLKIALDQNGNINTLDRAGLMALWRVYRTPTREQAEALVGSYLEAVDDVETLAAYASNRAVMLDCQGRGGVLQGRKNAYKAICDDHVANLSEDVVSRFLKTEIAPRYKAHLSARDLAQAETEGWKLRMQAGCVTRVYERESKDWWLPEYWYHGHEISGDRSEPAHCRFIWAPPNGAFNDSICGTLTEIKDAIDDYRARSVDA